MMFDAVFLSRIQFAFTISFHIIFPATTIGLASYLAFIEGCYLKTDNPIYKAIYKFWVKIFAITFGMGVVSGVVLSYQFGTNWAGFSHKVGNVLGPLLSFEVLTAFFLEASFLGIMLFGWNRVGPKMHFAATVIVAIGTLISAFWILAANSWMQTPQGFEVIEGIFYPLNWLEIIFNPSFLWRFTHMVLAAYLTVAFLVAGVCAWYLYKGRGDEAVRKMFAMALLFALFTAPTQIIIGDFLGLNSFKYQPAKVAAMEGNWENEKGASLKLFAIIDEENETNHHVIAIPKLSSLILTHDLNGEVVGLKSFPRDQRPPVWPVFITFRVMVVIGFLMLFTILRAVILYFRKRIFDSRWFQILCMMMTPSGFIAILAGWFVTEIGRQPYLVYGLLRTADVASAVSSNQVLFTLIAFGIVYFIIFGAATYYILRLIAKGLDRKSYGGQYV